MREIKVVNADTCDEDEVAACLAAVAQILQEEQESGAESAEECELSGWHTAALLEASGNTAKIRSINALPTSANLWQAAGRLWLTLLALLAVTGCAANAAGAPSASVQPQTASPAQQAPPVFSRPPLPRIAALEPAFASANLPAQPQAVLPPPADSLTQAVVSSQPVTMRVLLTSNVAQANVLVPDGATVKDVLTGDILADLPAQSQWQIEAGGGQPSRLTFSGILANRRPVFIEGGGSYRCVSYTSGLSANMVPLPADAPQHFWLPASQASADSSVRPRAYMLIPSQEGGVIQLSGKAYRGSLLIRANSGGNLDIINYIDMEAYLKSVVGCEMPSSWPAEALKAQAIAARSYAAAGIGKHESGGYDVRADSDDQVYKGTASESPPTVAAVDQTRGEVLRYQGKVISAFFHSGGGGYTEVAENVWGRHVPYLKAVADYDDDSPNFAWSHCLSTAQAEQMLADSGKSIGALLALMPISRGVSPRVRWLLASGTERSIMLTGEQARKIFGLPSACFNILGNDNCYVFAGRGSGHGLGMSQWGAKKLAEEGMRASDILKYYFKDVTVEQL